MALLAPNLPSLRWLLLIGPAIVLAGLSVVLIIIYLILVPTVLTVCIISFDLGAATDS